MLLKNIIIAVVLTLSCAKIQSISGEKILIFFPMSSKSMANLFEPLSRGLVERGHEVTIVTPVNIKIDSKNFTQIQPVTADELYADYPEPFELRRQSNIFRFPMDYQRKFCHKIFQVKEVLNLTNQTFDVIIANIIYHDCFAGLFYKIGSPIIWFSTLPLVSAFAEQFGNHMPSSFIPICLLKDISAQLTFIQRTKNFLYNAHFSYMLEYENRRPLAYLYREYLGDDIPTVTEIYKKQSSLALMNTHFSLTSPRPLFPSIVEIGGIHCKEAKPLPKDLKEFVEGAKDGFIVFSLGSIVKAKHMPESARKAFVEAFRKLKQRVIWKWEADGGMPDLSTNVKLVKWLPQQDLLGHPKIKLFITHGGLLSTQEALWHGVPVLGMPVFVDQDPNMKQAEILGFGVKGEILDLTEALLTLNINKILEDPTYMKRAKELSTIFRDQPETPLERAVYWTEYVMRHKGAYHLRSSAVNLNMIQYFCVDVIAFLFGVLVCLIVTIYYLIKITIRMTLLAFCGFGKIPFFQKYSALDNINSLKKQENKRTKRFKRKYF